MEGYSHFLWRPTSSASLLLLPATLYLILQLSYYLLYNKGLDVLVGMNYPEGWLFYRGLILG